MSHRCAIVGGSRSGLSRGPGLPDSPGRWWRSHSSETGSVSSACRETAPLVDGSRCKLPANTQLDQFREVTHRVSWTLSQPLSRAEPNRGYALSDLVIRYRAPFRGASLIPARSMRRAAPVQHSCRKKLRPQSQTTEAVAPVSRWRTLLIT